MKLMLYKAMKRKEGWSDINSYTHFDGLTSQSPPPSLLTSFGPERVGGAPQQGEGGSLLIRRLIFPMSLLSLLTNSPRAKPTAEDENFTAQNVGRFLHNHILIGPSCTWVLFCELA